MWKVEVLVLGWNLQKIYILTIFGQSNCDRCTCASCSTFVLPVTSRQQSKRIFIFSFNSVTPVTQRRTMYLKTLLCLVCVTVVCTAKKPVTKDNCEVCVTVVEKFEKTLSDEDRKDSTKLEKLFMDFCKGLRSKEERFCYYIGGLKTSATYILGTMSKPLKSFLPTLKICEKLRDVDSQICDLKYEKQIDLTKVDLKKLKVKDLKKILSDWGEDNACKGCAEKSDFVRKVEELMPRYAPEAAKQREEL